MTNNFKASEKGPQKQITFENKTQIRSKNLGSKKKRDSFIPKVVANRMARRIAFTTGLPTLSGMGVFIGSYLLIVKGIADVPPAITLTSSALCFFVGLLGLSYGILSASWEESPGSLLGLENIRPNIGRMRTAFRAVSPKNQS
ncbi:MULTISPECIES: PAM68 family protein [Prochlorococcus]|uniref:PAM68 family protein n=1 Tax=Prochlorococcus TaxID=1218 RepID=UPI0005338063|nr:MULTISPECIES: PAM68 family protein [Prochlorococcus]KGG12637.1 hypothetical protein EV05_1849 [Prochlorococcus sp. MIT 0601]